MEVDYDEYFSTSYSMIMLHKDQFYNRFYENFLARSPQLAAVFEGVEMKRQKRMLQIAIAHLVNFYVSKTATEYMIGFALQHKYELEATDKMYDQFMSALLKTLEDVLPNFDSKMKMAWRITLAPGIEFMKHIESEQN